MTEDRTEIPETETEVTETEKFGHKFGLESLMTEVISVISVSSLG
jgi:hypothetical protein